MIPSEVFARLLASAEGGVVQVDHVYAIESFERHGPAIRVTFSAKGFTLRIDLAQPRATEFAYMARAAVRYGASFLIHYHPALAFEFGPGVIPNKVEVKR